MGHEKQPRVATMPFFLLDVENHRLLRTDGTVIEDLEEELEAIKNESARAVAMARELPFESQLGSQFKTQCA